VRGVLIDTSAWVDHFRNHNHRLIELLALDLAMTHPLIVGEIACGTPPSRVQTLTDLGRLRQTQQASVREAITFVERERLFGMGCGLVDMLLLASTMMTPGVEFWTLDKRLSTLAKRFGVMYRPALH
jgi:predicted nucleic acid-binding protein